MDRTESLVDGARFDVCGYGSAGFTSMSALRHIHRAAVPGKGSVCLFKVLLTSECINDCAYCANQVGRDGPRSSLRPEELARVFVDLHGKNLVSGLFLSSGIGTNATRTMQSMIDTVEILRHNHRYRGYIHLKILPGAPFDCVEQACKLASRVSINMEAPTVGHLARLSSRKDLQQDILQRMKWVKQLTAGDDRLVPSGQTTQFVLGAAGETDRDVLDATAALYGEIGVRRVYFSPFRPVAGSRLEGVRPTPLLRAYRMYQADWLLRVYGFSPQEVDLALSGNGNLPLGRDPKLTIARKQPWLFPVDVNRASYHELIRVPGIGPASASRIIEARREHRVFSLQQLKKMRVATSRAAPFIWYQGMSSLERQASFLPWLDGDLVPKTPSLAEVVG